MIRLDSDKPVHFCDGLTRRDFLHVGMLGMMGFALTDWMTLKAEGRSCRNPRSLQADQDERAWH